MKIALATINSKYIHPSVALRILEKDLANHNIKTTLLEYNKKSDLKQALEQLINYDIVCFSTYIYNIQEISFLSNELKKLIPNIIIILGGPEVSYLNKQDAQKLTFDYIICGEGEKLLVLLVKALLDKETFQHPSLITKQQTNITMNKTINYVELNYAQPLVNGLDNLDLDNQIVYLETSRGCPYLCSYCQASIDNNVRNFPLDYILTLIKEILEKKVKIVKFLDRTFNYDVERINSIIKYIIENDNNYTTFQLEITGELLADSTIDLINDKARAGLFRFEIGIQSTNEKTNNSVRRYQNFNRLSQIINKIKAGNKVVLHLDLIAGLPYEDLTSFKKTFNQVFAFQAEELQLGFLKLLKGTHLQTLVDEHQYVFEQDAPYEVISNKYLSASDIKIIKDVEEALEQLYNHQKAKDFYLYLVEKYHYDYFDLLYQLSQIIGDHKQRYQLYYKIANSEIIKDNEDRISLLNNYYLDVKQRNKPLSKVLEKKKILHCFIDKFDLVQNEVFSASCLEEIDSKTYYLYLLKQQKVFILER